MKCAFCNTNDHNKFWYDFINDIDKPICEDCLDTQKKKIYEDSVKYGAFEVPPIHSI